MVIYEYCKKLLSVNLNSSVLVLCLPVRTLLPAQHIHVLKLWTLSLCKVTSDRNNCKKNPSVLLSSAETHLSLWLSVSSLLEILFPYYLSLFPLQDRVLSAPAGLKSCALSHF